MNSMRDWRLSFWLIAASVYALYNGFTWGRWQDLALWTRVHASIDVVAGLSMLLGGIVLVAMRSPLRAPVAIGAVASGVLDVSLTAGTLLGTIPCTGQS